jgi:hypothetical protein
MRLTMKGYKINDENTVGYITLNKDDNISTIGTYSTEYLLEALECFNDEYLTFGYYSATDCNDESMNCLIITDGNQNIGVAPRISSLNQKFVYTNDEMCKLIKDIKEHNGVWQSPMYRKMIGKLLIDEE